MLWINRLTVASDSMVSNMTSQLSLSTQLNVSEARNWMNNICGQHDLVVKNHAKLNFQHEFAKFKHDSIALGYIQYGTDASIINEKKLHCYSISLPLSGMQELDIGSDRILSNANKGLIINPQKELMLNISGDCKKLHLAIPKDKINQVLSHILREEIREDLIFDAEMNMDALAIAQWWRQISFYLDEIRLLGIESLQFMSVEIENLLIKKLLISQNHNYSSQLIQSMNQHLPRELDHVVQFMHEHYQSQISLAILCEISHTSTSKLNQLFNEYYHQTPMQYLKQIRLKKVFEMIKTNPRESITEIALAHGFVHMGHFSNDYKSMFQETAKQTAKRYLI